MKIEILDCWDEVLTSKDNGFDYDTYFCESYVKLYETELDIAESFFCELDDKMMIFPYLKRKVEYLKGEYWDFETAYGYGGPVFNTEDSTFIELAWEAFFNHLNDKKFIAGFVRFHPFFNQKRVKDKRMNCFVDRGTVWIDLRLSEEEIWKKEIHSKHRNVIKKAQKENLQFVVDESFDTIDDFFEIYTSTMGRLQASEFYSFDLNYYKKLKENLENRAFIGNVLKDGEIISTAIFFYDQDYGHYHLSGSKKEYLKFSPNNFMLYNAALYLKSLGVKKFHLGGGTDSDPQNSLYKFKKRFSKNESEFVLGKILFNKEKYQAALKEWGNENVSFSESAPNILLKYRLKES